MAKRIFSIIGGLVAGGIAVYIVEMISNSVYQLPENIDPTDAEALKAYIAQLPIGAFLFVLLAWGLGAFAGGFVAGIVHKEQRVLYALAVGAILMLFGLINLILYPHPVWFWIAGLAIYLPCAWLGAKLSAIIS